MQHRGFVRKNFALTFLLLALSTLGAMAQDAVPGEILQRTLLIKAGDTVGTAFTIDYQGKIYLLTAKHVVASLSAEKAIVQVWRSNAWQDLQTVRTLYPSSGDVDIAVFETNEKAPQPFAIPVMGQTDGDGPTMGQQIWFLGYPFGNTTLISHFKNGDFPFIKRGTMSAMDATNTDAIVYYIDGFNNPGFSGGPILYWDFKSHAYRIAGVVQGYRTDTAKVMVNGKPVDTNLLVNSGILVGYSIESAIQAIKASLK